MDKQKITSYYERTSILDYFRPKKPQSVDIIERVNGKEQVVEKQEFYENGQIKSKYGWDASFSVKNGPYTEFYENGQLKARGTNSYNLPTGTFEEFHENGKPKRKGCYTHCHKINNKQVVAVLHGAVVEFDTNGKVNRTSYYDNGREITREEFYHETRFTKNGSKRQSDLSAAHPHHNRKSKDTPKHSSQWRKMKEILKESSDDSLVKQAKAHNNSSEVASWKKALDYTISEYKKAGKTLTKEEIKKFHDNMEKARIPQNKRYIKNRRTQTER